MNGLVADVTILFDLNGERRRLSFRQVPFRAWQELKHRLNLTPVTLVRDFCLQDVEAVGAVIWLERTQRDRDLRWETVLRQLQADEFTMAIVDILRDGESLTGREVEPLDEDPTTSAGG